MNKKNVFTKQQIKSLNMGKTDQAHLVKRLDQQQLAAIRGGVERPRG